MKQPSALKDFMSMGDAALQSKSMNILSGLSGNAYFPNLSPSTTELNEVLQNYSSALAQSKNKDKAKIEDKNQLRDKLKAMLSLVVMQVNYLANGNLAMLLTTGLTISGQKATVSGFNGEINGLKILPGSNSGDIAINFKPVLRRRLYILYYGETPIQNDYWKTVTSNEASFTITGLQRGKEYSIRIGVVSPDGQPTYCATVNTLAL